MGFVERILREAIALPPHERAEFVDRSCGEDPRARQLLHTLLFSPEDQIAASASAADVETRADGSSHCPDRARRSVAEGRYEIGHKLGSGGQKDVYLARDTRLHRQVVVSFVRQNPDPSRLERFLREARAMAQLDDHPNIVPVYDFGDENGEPFIVTQYVAGGTLQSLLARDGRARLPLARALKIANDVCSALSHVHREGIVHRDVKPGNVWLSRDGIAKLGDFGLAYAPARVRHSGVGLLVGTPAYLAPEQALGHSIGPQADLYSLGVVLYEMAAGRPVFVGDSLASIVTQHVLRAPDVPSSHNPEIPAELDALILRLLQKDPAQRPTTATDVVGALGAITMQTTRGTATPLVALARDVFVGREQELDQLRSAFDAAVMGRGRIVLISGEAGSGKTYTVQHFLSRIRHLGAEVHVGRCHETSGAPPFWPWVQILRSLLGARRDTEDLRRALESRGAALADMDPEVARSLPGTGVLEPLESAQARFRLFDSFSTLVKNLSAAKPLLLFLDDLHWADEPSLLLLRFLASDATQTRVLIVAASRDNESSTSAIAAGLSSLSDTTIRLSLRGLQRGDVAAFIEKTAGHRPSDAMVESVYRSTEGNPFFVAEVVRFLLAEGTLRPDVDSAPAIAIPDRVRDVIDRRLAHFDRSGLELLRIGSLMGLQFNADVVAAAGDLNADRVSQCLEQATSQQVIAPVPGSGDAYAFTHALVRERLYEQMSNRERVTLHGRLAGILEQLHATDPHPPLGQIAFHFREGVPAREPRKALDYSVKAGAQALHTLAYERAADELRAALTVIDADPGHDWDSERCDVLLLAADALVKAGQSAAARTLALRASAIADARRWPDRLARSALAFGSRIGGVAGEAVDYDRMNVLEQALRTVATSDRALRARLMAHLALERYHLESLPARDAQSLEALQLAEASGDAEALIDALYARSIVLEGSEQVEERLRCASEIVGLGETLGRQELTLTGRYRRIRELLELCRTEEAERETHKFAALAETLRQPRYLWYARFCKAALALLRGQFADAERWSREASVFGQRAQDPVADLFLAVLDFSLHQSRGTMKQSEPAFKIFQERFPLVHWRSVLTALCAQTGQIDKSRALFEQLATNEFREIPRDGSWTASIVALCFTAEALGDARRGEQLYSLLLPYDGRAIVVGRSAVSYGAAARWLGMSAMAMGAVEKAHQHYEAAIRLNERMGARAHVARVKQEYARNLIARGGVERYPLAAQLLNDAERIANDVGLAHVIEGVQQLRRVMA